MITRIAALTLLAGAIYLVMEWWAFRVQADEADPYADAWFA